MGRTPCCGKKDMKIGPWTPEEAEILVEYIIQNGHGSWRSLPQACRWVAIAVQLPGRTDDEIKNLWNTPWKEASSLHGP